VRPYLEKKERERQRERERDREKEVGRSGGREARKKEKERIYGLVSFTNYYYSTMISS
jgi:hypothetical protein